MPLAFGAFNPSPGRVIAHLRAVAAGDYDDAYRYAARAVVAAGYPEAIVRLGWEFDGNWMPWSARGDPAVFIQAYRHVHDVFASVSARFHYDWTGTAGHARSWYRDYPGSRYVDIVGMDMYDEGLRVPFDEATGTWTHPTAAWRRLETSLETMERFALARGKEVSLPEFGLTGGRQYLSDRGGNPTFIDGIVRWANSLPSSGPGSLAFLSYFQGNPPREGPFALQYFPRAECQFFQDFGCGPGY